MSSDEKSLLEEAYLANDLLNLQRQQLTNAAMPRKLFEVIAQPGPLTPCAVQISPGRCCPFPTGARPHELRPLTARITW